MKKGSNVKVVTAHSRFKGYVGKIEQVRPGLLPFGVRLEKASRLDVLLWCDEAELEWLP